MRQIDVEAKHAFLNNRKFKLSNTEVRLVDGRPHMYLHGNCIAKRDENGDLLINHCGWETKTTKSRLNALPDVHISSHKGDFVLNDIYIMPSEWINVKYYTLKFYL
jgi:hypothetical protein